MSCCGKKREVMQQRRRSMTVMPRPVAHSPMRKLTAVAFKGTGAYLVAGPHTREVYHFSANAPEQWVEAKDAEGLVATGLFEAVRVSSL